MENRQQKVTWTRGNQIWAEQNGVIENQKFEWSSGSGAEGPTHRHSGYTIMASGRILRMGLGGAAGNSPIPFKATVNVVVNGREKEAAILQLADFHPHGDRINFRSASGNPNVISAVVSLLIQLDM